MFGLGAGEEHPQLHASDYDFPDALIGPGIETFERIVRALLGPGKPAATVTRSCPAGQGEGD